MELRSRRQAIGIAALDFILLVLVVFPALTGGAWIQRPGLFVELSDLAIPVLLVSIVAVLLKLAGTPVERSRVARAFLRAWSVWQNEALSRPGRALGLGTGFFAMLWSTGALLRHWGLGSHAQDLGVYTNGIWNFSFGHGYVSFVLNGLNLLSDHQSWSYLALAPLFRLFPRAETLLIYQAIVLAWGGGATFFLTRQFLSRDEAARAGWLIAVAPILYWLYLPLRNAGFSDFHPEAAMPAFFLWGAAGIQARAPWKRAAGVLCLVLGMGLKEACPPVAVAMGLAWLLGAGPANTRSFTRGVGAVVIGLAFAVLVFDLKVVPGLVGAVVYNHASDLVSFGGGMPGLILAPVLKPSLFWPNILGPARLRFLFWTLAPLGFLPLTSPVASIAAIPGYLMLFLQKYDYRITTFFHYAIPPAVGLFFALPGSLARIARMEERRRAWAAIWIVFWCLGTNGRSDGFRIRGGIPGEHARWVTGHLIPALDPGLSLAAPESYVPHVAARRWVSFVPVLSRPDGKRVSCVIVDPQTMNFVMGAEDVERFRASLPAEGYRSIYRCGKVEVFQLSTEIAQCISRVPECPADGI